MAWWVREIRKYFIFLLLFTFFSKRPFATLGTTVLGCCRARKAAGNLKSMSKLGKIPSNKHKHKHSQACQRGPRLCSLSISASLSLVQSEQIACMAFSLVTEKDPHGFCGVLEHPWPSSAAGQEHKESALVLFAGCSISCGGVDGFKSLTFELGCLATPWICQMGNLDQISKGKCLAVPSLWIQLPFQWAVQVVCLWNWLIS